MIYYVYKYIIYKHIIDISYQDDGIYHGNIDYLMY
jgi:hypothetical protein